MRCAETDAAGYGGDDNPGSEVVFASSEGEPNPRETASPPVDAQVIEDIGVHFCCHLIPNQFQYYPAITRG
jgi:hypothetical protein